MPQSHAYGNGEITSSIVKTLAQGPVLFSKSGPEGDQPSNHTNAVYAFSDEDYAYWNEQLKPETAWANGFLGENLTLSGIDQSQLHIGDKLHIGTAILQVSGVRIPCSTLIWRINQPKSFIPQFQNSGRSGFYMEVVKEGVIEEGDNITHEPLKKASVSIPEFAKFFMQAKKSAEDLSRYLHIEGMGSQMLDALTAELNQRIDQDLANSNRWKDWREFVVSRIVDESNEVKSFHIRPKDGQKAAGYRAGQFLNVRLKVPSQDSHQDIIRSWSISDYDDACHSYRMSIKRLPNGTGSNFMHDQVKEGDVIEILNPSGRFVLERSETDKPVVLISAGIGITPMISMLKSHAARKDKILPTLYFIHATQNSTTEVFKDEVNAIVAKNDEIKNYTIHTRPIEGNKKGVDFDSSERLNHAHLQAILKDMVSWFSGAYVPVPPIYCRFYLCGPEAFQKDIIKDLIALDVPEEQIHKEAFHAKEEDCTTELIAANVIYHSTDTSQPIKTLWLPEENHSLLEQAEANALSPSFGCRNGTCGLCSSKLLKGEIVYSKKTSIEIPEGEALLCCSYPNGIVEIAL